MQEPLSVSQCPEGCKIILPFLFVIRKVSLLGTLQNIAGWDGITEIASEGQFEMNKKMKHGYVCNHVIAKSVNDFCYVCHSDY